MLTPLLSDNTRAINIAHDLVKHELTKYVGVDAHFMRSKVHDGVVALQYVPSELQLTDFFMKAQTRAHHQIYLSKLSVVDPPWVWGGIKYVLVFLLLYFSRWFFVYSPPPVHVYIWASDPQMNTSAIRNRNNKQLSRMLRKMVATWSRKRTRPPMLMYGSLSPITTVKGSWPIQPAKYTKQLVMAPFSMMMRVKRQRSYHANLWHWMNFWALLKKNEVGKGTESNCGGQAIWDFKKLDANYKSFGNEVIFLEENRYEQKI
jgi:hypothetical protein